MSERCELTSEGTSEQPSTQCFDIIVIKPNVSRLCNIQEMMTLQPSKHPTRCTDLQRTGEDFGDVVNGGDILGGKEFDHDPTFLEIL